MLMLVVVVKRSRCNAERCVGVCVCVICRVLSCSKIAATIDSSPLVWRPARDHKRWWWWWRWWWGEHDHQTTATHFARMNDAKWVVNNRRRVSGCLSKCPACSRWSLSLEPSDFPRKWPATTSLGNAQNVRATAYSRTFWQLCSVVSVECRHHKISSQLSFSVVKIHMMRIGRILLMHSCHLWAKKVTFEENLSLFSDELKAAKIEGSIVDYECS